jgi:hypothetical protein
LLEQKEEATDEEKVYQISEPNQFPSCNREVEFKIGNFTAVGGQPLLSYDIPNGLTLVKNKF